MSETRRRLHPPSRPDGTVFRSGRASTPPPEWGLIPTDPARVRAMRYASGLRSQRQLAEMLSSALHVVPQTEIVELERGTCWANGHYIERLAEALHVRWADVVDSDLLEEQHRQRAELARPAEPSA